MPLPSDLPVVDHHCHLSPSGDGVRAVQRFRQAGGTHLFLATQNYGAKVPRTVEEYADQFSMTEALARRAEREAGVIVYLVVAPYPVDLVPAVGDLGAAGALSLHCAALDLAGRWVRERRAVALGEVGFPHFPVDAEVDRVAREVFDHALAVARDSDCPVVVHSRDLDSAGYLELARRADRTGLRRERVVKHYARNRLSDAERSSVTPSYLARRELVRAVTSDPGPWFLETDYLDDSSRPGAVLDLSTVPRRAKSIAATDLDRLRVPFVESIDRVYGFRPEPIPRGDQ